MWFFVTFLRRVSGVNLGAISALLNGLYVVLKWIGWQSWVSAEIFCPYFFHCLQVLCDRNNSCLKRHCFVQFGREYEAIRSRTTYYCQQRLRLLPFFASLPLLSPDQAQLSFYFVFYGLWFHCGLSMQCKSLPLLLIGNGGNGEQYFQISIKTALRLVGDARKFSLVSLQMWVGPQTLVNWAEESC